jgi:glycosyltransferase involved in cell wall biosynthesis
MVNFAKQYGGVEKHIEDLIDNVDKNQIKIHILCRKNSMFEHKIINKFNNINIINTNFSKSNLVKDFFKIRKYIKKNNINIIHSHGISANLITMILKTKNIKTINTVHGYSDFDRMERSNLEKDIYKKIEIFSMKRNSKCIAVSNDVKGYLIEKGIEDNKIVVIYHGVKDLSNYYIKTHTNKCFVIGSLGRLEKVKGYDIFIKAINYCKVKGYNNIVCKVAGSGSERDNLLNIINRYNLNEEFILLGHVDDVDSFLESLDIYVQPSLIESFGIAIVEAMQRGLPVIATNSGGVKEIIHDNINGLLFKSNDYEDLGDKIINLIENKDKMMEIAVEGINSIKNEFNIRDRVNEYEKIIHNLTYS